MVFLMFVGAALVLATLGALEASDTRALGSLGIAFFGLLMLSKRRVSEATKNMPLPLILLNRNAEAVSAACLLIVCAALILNRFM